MCLSRTSPSCSGTMHARKVMDSRIGDGLAEKAAAKGINVLAWGENGFRHLTNSVRPVVTVADFKGLQIRTMENVVHQQAFRAMGALPKPIPFTELYGALDAKSVDGEENPLAVIVSANFGKVQKYVTLTAHVYSPAPFIASSALLAKLTPEDRDNFKAAAQMAAAAMRQRVSAIERSGVDALRAQGVQVTTEFDRDSFVSAVVKNAYPPYEKRFGAEALAAVRAVK